MDDRTKLERRLRRNPAAILKTEEIDLLIQEAKRMLTTPLSPLIAIASRSLEDVLRWGSLKARCEQARADRNLDIKTASSQARIPRYRVVAIESGRFGEFRPELAWRYFEFLGLRSWVQKWARSNKELASRAGMVSTPDATKGGRKSNTAIQRSVSRVTALAGIRKGRATRPLR